MKLNVNFIEGIPPSIITNKFIIGLPAKINNNSRSLFKYGHFVLGKNYRGSVSDFDRPLREPFYFFTNEGDEITDIKRTINFFEMGNTPYNIVYSGYFFDDSGKHKDPIPICYDREKESLINRNDGSLISLENVDVALGVVNRSINCPIKIVSLLKTDNYKFLQSLNYKLDMFIENYKLPNKEKINEIYRYYKSNLIEHSFINCIEGKILFPTFLKYLCGSEGSPMFQQGNFGKESYHQLNGEQVKIIFGWMIDLVMLRKLPTLEILVENEFNLDEWIYITDYLNIPFFQKFFEKIKTFSMEK
jgi:hypothetical protein